MTKMAYKYLELWDDELSFFKIFEECFNASNTHFIIDACKEAIISELELNKKPGNFEIELLKCIEHNALNGNRVSVVTGTYMPTAEEPYRTDLTLPSLEIIGGMKRHRLSKVDPGSDLGQLSVDELSPHTRAVLSNFFDNVYHWPTYFLVWNGTKVARPALNKLRWFPEEHDIEYLFSCRNRVAKPHRVLLLNELNKRGLLNHNHWTLLDPHDEVEDVLFDITLDDDRHYISGKTVDDDYDPHALYSTPPGQYYSSLIDVVTETAIDSTFRTEKSVWPIVYMKPFMIVGARFINNDLRKYGFKLYDELIDYRFDTIESPRERIQAVADELQRLQSLDLDLNEQYKLLQPKLEHNLKVYLELCYNDTYMPPVIKQLAEEPDLISQQLVKRPYINPETGTWHTFIERNGGNGTIMDIVRRKESQYLQQIMGGLK